MAGWDEILFELGRTESPIDRVRRKYIKALSDYTGRNTIIYYSSWLLKPQVPNIDINDLDMGGFMNSVKGMDCTKGLDLILHTPGGTPSAAEAIVNYLKDKFNKDIRVIVPQLAMSAGTMIACSAKEIIMGKQSSLGPVDPQFSGIPAHNILEEYYEAKADLAKSPVHVHYWSIKLSQFPAAFMKSASDAIDLSEQLLKSWLKDNMFFSEVQNVESKAQATADINVIVNKLSNHSESMDHSRHLGYQYCKDIKLKIQMMEEDQDLQDKILSIHHATLITFEQTNATKIIENHMGKAYIPTHA